MKLNQKWMLFLIASFTTFFGIVNTLVKETAAIEDTPINESFDDLNFYKCVVSSYNKQFNKEVDYLTISLSDQELSLLTVLECSGFEKEDSNKVTSSKGLEKMVALERLDLSYNLLSVIDISNNKNLNYLNISYNELTEIDLSNNNKLKTYIPDSNIIADEIDDENYEFETDLPSTNISSLKLSEGDIVFEPEVTEYFVTVSSFEQLMAYVKLESSTSTYMIEKKNVGEEKIIVVMVTASDESSKTYTISVIEDGSLNQELEEPFIEKENKFVPIFIVIICLLVFINVFRIVKSKINRK